MNIRANKLLLLVSSLATLALLLVAALKENWFRDWRAAQRAYRSLLPAGQAADFQVQLRQVYAPGLRAADRCVSCHVGMAPGENGLKGKPLFVAHPNVVHDPMQYGCVVCHAGQGRATEEADAHGTAEFWPEPMLPKKYSYAGCGTCHTHLAVANLAETGRGRALFERHDCLSCHALDGRGGTLRPGAAKGVTAPDLSRAGAAGFRRDWYEHHLAERARAEDPSWKTSVGEITAQNRRDIEAFLATRVGAPGLVEAKALFHSLGCRGCHKIGGVGGDDGPDLTFEGSKDPARLDYTHVIGKHTLPNWLDEHFRAPSLVVPGSLMPILGLRNEEIDSLVFYLMSLRRSNLPEAYWPKDRVRAERLGEREFATDGATLYGTFCSACHGPRGEGMRYSGMPAFPAVGNPDFLAIASDRFLSANVTHGRPGRRMPAWGDKEGGLRPTEIEAVVAHLRALGNGIPAPQENEPARWVKADRTEGETLYKESCATCHGAKGEGKEGPALNNPVLLQSATDRYLVETVIRGRRGTSMPSFRQASTTHRALSDREIEAIVSFIRTWEVTA